MPAPQPPRADRGPLRGLLLILLAVAGLVLLVIGYNRLTAGSADARLCLPVGLVFVALLASAPLAYAAFQEQLTTAELLRRLGQSRVAWTAAALFTGVSALALVAMSVTGINQEGARPGGTPLVQRLTPAATVSPTLTDAGASPTATTTMSVAATVRPTDTPPPAATNTPATAPTATPQPPTRTAAPTNTPESTETLPPTATPTLVPPDPVAQIDQAMIEANDLLVALIENPNAPRDPLRAYYCGDDAWRKISGYLTRTTTGANRPTGATYTISDVQPAIQDLDERWRLEQVETWTYTTANGQERTTREAYVYWLVATESGAPAFCIDDYTSQTLAP